MKKNLKSLLSTANQAAALESRNKAAVKLRRHSPTPDRARVSVYLSESETAHLQKLRVAIVGVGLKPVDNSLVLAALLAVDPENADSFVGCYRAVQANDRRRKAA